MTRVWPGRGAVVMFHRSVIVGGEKRWWKFCKRANVGVLAVSLFNRREGETFGTPIPAKASCSNFHHP